MIPITPMYLTGDVLEAADRGYLEGHDLARWSEALLDGGIDTDAVIQAICNPAMPFERVRPVFSAICREIGLSDDVNADLAALKATAMVEEYRHGHRKAAELFWRFDDLRRRVKFPELVHLRLQQDNSDGTNDSGYYTDSKALQGDALETAARQCLARAGILIESGSSPGGGCS